MIGTQRERDCPRWFRLALYLPLGTLIWTGAACLVAAGNWMVLGPSVVAGLFSGALAAFVFSN